MLKQAFDHITAPVDEYHMCVLRNAALCGVLAFVLVIVGVSQLMMFIVYLLVIAVVCVLTWLYKLTPALRAQVLDRVRDVITAIWRNCVDDAFGPGAERGGKTTSPPAPEPGTGAGRVWWRQNSRRTTKNDDDDRPPKTDDGRQSVPPASRGNDDDGTPPKNVEDSIDILSRGFTSLFDTSENDNRAASTGNREM